MKSRSIFITGTDTDVGKTWFTVQLVKKLRAAGVDAVAFKPIECGEERSDAQALVEACEGQLTLDQVNPIWFSEPVAPMVASRSTCVDIEKIRQAHRYLCKRHSLVFVEGAGGWLVPLTETISMAELAAELCESVIVVALNRLGVINHTLLTCAAIDSNPGITAKFVYLNANRTGYDSDRTGYDLSMESNFSSLRHCLSNWTVYDEQGMEDLPCDDWFS